jgi:flagellar biosynthesis/type III secretory pathway protein FliH
MDRRRLAGMSLRFRPPPLAGFYEGDGADHAAALVLAREQGFAEGHASGAVEAHAAGVAEGEARTRDAMEPELNALQQSSAKREQRDSVAQALRHLLDGREHDLLALEKTVRDVVTVALRALFPVLLSHAAGAEIAALVAVAMTERGHETLTLRAHPDTLAAVVDETKAAVADGRLVLAADEKRGLGAVDVAWTGGGLTFDPAALLAQVTAALAPPDLPPPIPSPIQPELAPPPPDPPAPFHVPEPQKALP